MRFAMASSSMTSAAGNEACAASIHAIGVMGLRRMTVEVHAALHSIATMSLGCARGASAVEFALIAPVLIMLLAGMVDFGNVYLVKNQMNEVAREAARRVATGKLSPDEAVAFVGKRLADTVKATVGVVVVETPLGADEDDGADLTVVVSVPLADIMTFGFLMPSAASPEPTEDASGKDKDKEESSDAGTRTDSDNSLSEPITLVASATMLKE